jgi:hypothetical protein
LTTPTTSIDTACSDPGAQPTSWDAAVQVLRGAELFWIATVRRSGKPHVTPLVAIWLDDAIHFCTGEGERKELNLRANPQVVVMTGTNEWDRGLDVVVEGMAVRVLDAPTLMRLAEAWGQKWDGRWAFQPRAGGFGGESGGTVLVFAVRPAKVLAFGRGTFTATTHRF